jgi:hypothetical protein
MIRYRLQSVKAQAQMDSMPTYEAEIGVMHNVLCERAIVRRSREELHVGAEVVAARTALYAATARNAGLDSHSIPNFHVLDARTDLRKNLVQNITLLAINYNNGEIRR